MSKKKHKQKEPDQAVPTQEIPIEDDPYWKISTLHLDMHRVGRFLMKFERFDEEYPEWTDALLDGTPTWYCVLGVPRGASEKEIEEAYKKKIQFSYFGRDYIEEAYDVLSDKSLQKKYDELLFIFEQYTKCLTPSEKNELIENHNKNVKCEKDFIRMGKIKSKYSRFMDIYHLGAPDLYEIIGIGHEAAADEIKKKCENGSELYKKIGTILGDPQKRQDYDFIMYFIGRYALKTDHEERERKMKKWKKFDRPTVEQIIINALDQSEDAQVSQKRVNEIMAANQDWVNYLPPKTENFFSILGVERNSLTGDKKEIERVLREKYRDIEKTPQVNLAYSVLKNESQRDDYIWLFENIDMFNKIKFLFSDEEEEEEGFSVKPGRGRAKKTKSTAKKTKKKPSQITFEDFEQMFWKIIKGMH